MEGTALWQQSPSLLHRRMPPTYWSCEFIFLATLHFLGKWLLGKKHRVTQPSKLGSRVTCAEPEGLIFFQVETWFCMELVLSRWWRAEKERVVCARLRGRGGIQLENLGKHITSAIHQMSSLRTVFFFFFLTFLSLNFPHNFIYQHPRVLRE